MDETLELLNILLDGVSEQRLKLISHDEARALMVLLGILEAETQDGDIQRAAGELRFRLGSRLAVPPDTHATP
ncbi:hypothetical protein [Streptomyces goshikiensis]|uniref:hypothetical protein n=1 Tax=Streptomyces goshikiensis TaxID=1942 RepID=UPI0036B5E2E4